LLIFEPDLWPAGWIERSGVECAGRQAALQSEQRDYRFENAGRPQRVANSTFD
jgi:hypothetical protein